MLLHGGNFGEDVLDFSVNTNPCVTNEMMSELLEKHGEKALIYPEIDGNSLLDMLCENTGIEPDRMVLGNGAIDCLYRAMAALKPKTAVIVEPTFSEYRRSLELVGCDVYSLPYDVHKSEEENELNLIGTLDKVKADLVVLCNPNNPTGHLYTQAFIDELLRRQRIHKGYLMVDESFRFFEDIPSVYHKDAWNLIVLTSLTKYYGIPGLRIGYLTTNHSLVEAIKKREMPWNINGVVLAVTKDLLKDKALKTSTKNWYKEEKAYLHERLSQLEGVEVLPTNANYFLCYCEDKTGTEINEVLLEGSQAMGVRNCASFTGLGDHDIRIGLRDHQANEMLMDALETMLIVRGHKDGSNNLCNRWCQKW